MDIFQKTENPKYLKKPYDNNNYYNSVEDVFYLMIHWNIIVDKP
jgi:hypothetical protein